jgi:hypothetical protein
VCPVVASAIATAGTGCCVALGARTARTLSEFMEADA